MNAITNETCGIEFLNDNLVLASVESLSEPGTHHLVAIWTDTRIVDCPCRSFECRFANQEPTIDTPNLHCRHVRVAVAQLVASGTIKLRCKATSPKRCSKCRRPGAQHRMVDDNGNNCGYICQNCIDNRDPAAYYPEQQPGYEPEHVPTWDEGMQAYP